VSAEESIVPSWVKNNAGWWAQDKITDSDFLEGIKFLIGEKIITIPQSTSITASKSSEMIPSWIKNNAGWWSDGLIEESEFVSSIQFLIENGIISINQKASQSINFAIAGDFAVNDDTKKNLKNIESVDPEIILFVGDLRNDNGTPQGWFEMTEFLGKDRIRIALGNHDVQDDEPEQYKNYYGLENVFHSFDYENVHFIVLDTDAPIFIGSEQFKFLKSDLKNARENSNIDWIIVGLHRSIYSDGPHIYHSVYVSELSVEYDVYLRNILQPLFDYYKVDLVLQGHNQFYERFKPLKFNEIVTNDESSNYVDPEGQLYVTVGTGGDKLHTPIKKSDSSVFQTNEFFGFLNLELSSDGKSIHAEFFNLDMEVIDEFQITQQKKNQLNENNLLGINLAGRDFTSADLTMSDLSGKDLLNTIFRNTDLTYADLSYSNLTGADLRGANLHGAKLEGADFSGVDFTGANLSLVNLWEMDLSNVILDGTTLYGTILGRTDLSDKKLADLRMTDFTNTDLSNADLSGSLSRHIIFNNTNLKDADLSNIMFERTDFSNSYISGANFENSLLYLTNFTNMDLSDVNISGTTIPGSDLRDIDFRENDLTDVDFSAKIMFKSGGKEDVPPAFLIRANLSGMDLREVIFSREHNIPDEKWMQILTTKKPLTGATLAYANLSGSILSGKNIYQVDNLIGVNLYNADLSDADLSESILTASNLIFADLTNANLKGVDLTFVNLEGAILTNANLEGADLTNANLRDTVLTNANLEGAILNCFYNPICNNDYLN